MCVYMCVCFHVFPYGVPEATEKSAEDVQAILRYRERGSEGRQKDDTNIYDIMIFDIE